MIIATCEYSGIRDLSVRPHGNSNSGKMETRASGGRLPYLQISGEKTTLHGVFEPPSRFNRATLSGG